MGFSLKKKNKKGKVEENGDHPAADTATKKKKKFGRKSKQVEEPPPPVPTEPTMSMVPQLTEELGSSDETSGEKAARALRMLFSLSEHSTTENNRAVMVQGHEGKLVPVLLNFLQRCDRSSSEQYLALLVLNNVSIPAENKKVSNESRFERVIFQEIWLTFILRYFVADCN